MICSARTEVLPEVLQRIIVGESGANWHPRVSAHVAVANLWR